MTSTRARVYVETSVFGGAFDQEFAAVSNTFFEQARAGRFELVTSAVVQVELEGAPPPVQALFRDVLAGTAIAPIPEEAWELQQAYLEAGIVTSRSALDALHVAVATVLACDLIISWNFRHIVHFQKIPLYNAVNQQHGYRAIAIHSPLEVIGDEDEDV